MPDTTHTLIVTLPNDTDILMTRVFNAQRHLVFDAFTQPEHVRQWWGPRNTKVTFCEIDLRVGGTWRFVLEDEGTDVAFNGVYREIARPDRLVNTEVFEMFPDNVGLVTMVLTEENGKTTATVTTEYESKAVRDSVIESGMESGAAESYDRMEELLATMS